jgi:very-short-patch-repair endonuclease
MVFADVETKTRVASSLCVPPLDCVCGPRPPPRPSPFQGEKEGGEGRAMSVAPGERLGSSSPCKGEDRWGSAASRFSRRPEATARARSLRRAATQAEKKLWYVLQRGQVSGLSFRRQHPLGGYVMDFYCPAIRRAIEVDGGQHNGAHGRARDERRSKWLQGKGVTVLRFWNNDVLGNIEGVWEEIERTVARLSSADAIVPLPNAER